MQCENWAQSYLVTHTCVVSYKLDPLHVTNAFSLNRLFKGYYQFLVQIEAF